MKRILQIGFSDNPGGVENVVMNYYYAIDKKEYQFDFLDIYGNGIAYQKQIENLGGRIYTTANYKRKPISSYRQIKRIIKRNGYCCIHVHMQSAANLLPILAGINSGVRVIAHSHSSSTPKGIARKIFHSINVIILRHIKVEKYACGELAGKWMWGKSFEKNKIIPNATDLSRFKPDKEKRTYIRERIGFQDSIVIGFVGRFGQEKNTFFLIDVLEKMLKKNKHVRLLTVGGNDLYSEFERKIVERNLSKYYYSAGIRKDTSEWYNAMDAFLMPSFFEGFPMVGIEAQAAGLRCFISNNVSSEINITGNVIFLPIDSSNAAEAWADRILKEWCFVKKISDELEKYDINNAVLTLADVYSHST